jgi:hypothetical protein
LAGAILPSYPSSFIGRKAALPHEVGIRGLYGHTACETEWLVESEEAVTSSRRFGAAFANQMGVVDRFDRLADRLEPGVALSRADDAEQPARRSRTARRARGPCSAGLAAGVPPAGTGGAVETAVETSPTSTPPTDVLDEAMTARLRVDALCV